MEEEDTVNGLGPISRPSTLAWVGSPTKRAGIRRNIGRSLLPVLLGCLSLLALPVAALAGSGSISGTVVEAGSKAPLSGIEVTVYEIGAANPAALGQPLVVAKTNADAGNYTVSGLAAASYRVEFSDPQHKYAPQYYENTRAFDERGAKPVLVEEGKATLGIDAELREGATISGTVEGAPSNEPLVNAQVVLFSTEGHFCTSFPSPCANCPYRGAATDSGGKYAVSGLPRGSYEIEFLPSKGENFVPEFLEEAASLRFAKAVPIEEVRKYEINAKLKVGGEISGTVTDAPTHTPLAGIEVFPSNPELEAFWWLAPFGFPDAATTNAHGEYTIMGLATGSYTSNFVAPYPYRYIGQSVRDVAVTLGTTKSGINVALIRQEPVNTEPPVLSGSPAVGHTLSCANGSWTGLGWTEVSPYTLPSPFHYTYAWLRDGSLIGAGTRSTYVVQPRDQGHGLACQVIAANVVSQGVTATSNTLRVPAAPTIESLKQSHSRWREGSGLASYSHRRAPVGTTFRFFLNQSAAVSFAFSRRLGGRKVGGECVAQARVNRRKPGCTRRVTQGTLTFMGHPGLNTLAFQGRISGSKRLPLGAYTVRIVAMNSAGETSTPRSLSFAIVR
jgi:hypothetical protein